MHEARKRWQELGTEPSIRQLANIQDSEEEIADIVSLAKEVKQGE